LTGNSDIATVVFLERMRRLLKGGGFCETGTGTSSPAAVNNDAHGRSFLQEANRKYKTVALELEHAQLKVMAINAAIDRCAS
jgi:hypothetical protein